MSRRSELTINTGLWNLGKKILIYISADISLMKLFHHGINFIHGIHNLGEHQRSIYLEDCVIHIFAIGRVLVSVKILYKREYPFLDNWIHSLCREVVEGRPLKLITINLTVSDLNLIRKNALIRKSQHSGFLCTEVVRIIQVLYEHEICHLFHNIKRICDSSVPKNFPQAINLISKFSGHC